MVLKNTKNSLIASKIFINIFINILISIIFVVPATQMAAAKDTLGPWENFNQLRRQYRQGEIDDQTMWAGLTTINEGLDKLPKDQQATVLQTQASVLERNGYPILAAINASQSLKKATNPYDDEWKRSWTIIKDVSASNPIQNLQESVAEDLLKFAKDPVSFGTDWKYIEGNVLLEKGQLNAALEAYSKVKTTDRYFYSAKFQQAMIHLNKGAYTDAVANLKAILNPTTQSLSTLSSEERRRLTDDANMALGRIYYEQKDFTNSLRHFRLITRDSELYYNALFEQSWALFMAGYPNHALGMLYSVRGPFYPDAFNPEATMLASIIYYWMCRYNDARNELADFVEQHKDALNQLSGFITRKVIDSDTAYMLFENTVTGVSSEGLGMQRNLLASASTRDSMMHARDQYAAVLSELQRLQAKGIFDSQVHTQVLRGYLDTWSNALKKDIGNRFVTELKSIHRDFERLHEQAQFLYIELLMSQKDQLLGKELHSNSKIDQLVSSSKIKGWGEKMQVYASDDKMEYWKDEVGFHIFSVQPMCK
jgi:tetratricopeptide (TPR) repeat protein